MTRNDCRRNVIMPVNIWPALVAACDGNPFSPGRNNSVPTIPAAIDFSTLSTRSPGATSTMENTISGRLSARNWSIIRGIVGRLVAGSGPTTHLSMGSRTRTLCRGRVKCRSRWYNSITSRFTPALGSAIAFPVPRVVFLGIVFFPSFADKNFLVVSAT